MSTLYDDQKRFRKLGYVSITFPFPNSSRKDLRKVWNCLSPLLCCRCVAINTRDHFSIVGGVGCPSPSPCTSALRHRPSRNHEQALTTCRTRSTTAKILQPYFFHLHHICFTRYKLPILPACPDTKPSKRALAHRSQKRHTPTHNRIHTHTHHVLRRRLRRLPRQSEPRRRAGRATGSEQERLRHKERQYLCPQGARERRGILCQ